MPQLALPPQGRKEHGGSRSIGDSANKAGSAPASTRMRSLAQVLEPRVMLDAAALATFAEVVPAEPESDDSPSSGDHQTIAPEGHAPASEIVFIDTGIVDWQLLLLDLPVDIEVVMLDSSRNGLEQIADHLGQRTNLAAIHIITHGAEATAFIGGARLDLGNVDAYASALGVIGAALIETGDILFYGCDIAASEDGASLIARIAALTGADVAASTNLTGAQELGGDWVLESATGEIEAQLVVGWEAQAAFVGLLAFTQESGADNPMDGIKATISPVGEHDYIGDFTGNGFDDLIARNPDNDGIVFWRNNGDGTWTQLTGAANPFAAISLAGGGDFNSNNAMVLDIDGDGDLDVYSFARDEFWRNDNGSFSVHTGAGNPLSGFKASVGGIAQSFVTGDFTGNGQTDIAARHPDLDKVVFWRNNGDGTWDHLTGVDNPFNAVSFPAAGLNFIQGRLVVADIDGDGWLDIYNHELNEFWRNNNGTFEQLSGVNNPLDGFKAVAPTGFSFVPGDFTGNGYTDLVARNADNNALIFWRNNGDGTWDQLFGAANPFNGIALSGGPDFVSTRVKVLDVDGDGDIDIYNREINAVYENSNSLPALTSSVPAPGAAAVSPSANIVLNFSEAVSLGTGTAGTTNATGYGDIAIYDAATNTLIERINVVANADRIAGAGTTTITIDPVGDLPGGANIYVLIGSKAFVSTGTGNVFLGIDQADVFTFSVFANAAPVIGNLAGDTAVFTEGGAAILLDVGSDATVSDADSPNFNGGSLTVSITSNLVAAQDVLGISTAGVIALSAGMTNGSTVSVSGTAIGTIGSNGSGGADLVVNFNANATPSNVQALVRALTYLNSNNACLSA